MYMFVFVYVEWNWVIFKILLMFYCVIKLQRIVKEQLMLKTWLDTDRLIDWLNRMIDSNNYIVYM